MKYAPNIPIMLLFNNSKNSTDGEDVCEIMHNRIAPGPAH